MSKFAEIEKLLHKWKNATVWIAYYTTSLKRFQIRLEKTGSFANLIIETYDLFHINAPVFWENSQLVVERMNHSSGYLLRDERSAAEICIGHFHCYENAQPSVVGKRYAPILLTNQNVVPMKEYAQEITSLISSQKGRKAYLSGFQLIRTDDHWDNLLEICFESPNWTKRKSLYCIGTFFINSPFEWLNSSPKIKITSQNCQNMPCVGYRLFDETQNVDIYARKFVLHER